MVEALVQECQIQNREHSYNEENQFLLTINSLRNKEIEELKKAMKKKLKLK